MMKRKSRDCLVAIDLLVQSKKLLYVVRMTRLWRKDRSTLTSSDITSLRAIRDKIAKREVYIETHIAGARRRSDRRVKHKSEKLAARNELEDALLELEDVGKRHWAEREEIEQRQNSLRKEFAVRRLDILAASPPFVLKLEQALMLVHRLQHREAASPSPDKEPRWRSSVVALMKDVSDAIGRRKYLGGGDHIPEKKHKELASAAASARLLSIHINAWSLNKLEHELDRIGIMSLKAEATGNPKLEERLEKWQATKEQLDLCAAIPAMGDREDDDFRLATERVRQCQDKAEMVVKGRKPGWWEQQGEELLKRELKHLDSHVTSMAGPTEIAARYNLLLAKCAEIGAWQLALAAFRSIQANCFGVDKQKTKVSSISGPIVYQHLLRAAKNSRPPRPRAALRVLEKMWASGERPSAFHYNIVLGACARAAAVASAGVHTRRCPSETTNLKRRDQERPRQASKLTPQHEPYGGITTKLSGGQIKDTCIVHPWAVKEAPGKLTDCPKAENNGHGVIGQLAMSEHSDRKGCTVVGNGKIEALTSSPLCGGIFPHALEPETPGDAWHLALNVVLNMRRKGINPTNVTYSTLIETCRRASGATLLSAEKGIIDGPESTSPAEIYTVLSKAGIPRKVCYDAAVKNALRGGRCYPSYVAELY